MKLLLALLFVASQVGAAVFQVNEKTVEFQSSNFMVSELIKNFASHNKYNVVFDSSFQDSEVLTFGPRSLPLESLELYISTMLFQSGFGMRILPETRTLSVFNSRDVRYLITSTFKDLSKVPDTYEHVQFMYELKHVPSAELASNLRPFMGRYGRIVDHTNSILISDTGTNVKRVMQIVQELDTPAYSKSAAEVKELNEKNKKTITQKKGILDILGDNNVIFLVLFALVGAVIGFGMRGYMMKRIEGGW